MDYRAHQATPLPLPSLELLVGALPTTAEPRTYSPAGLGVLPPLSRMTESVFWPLTKRPWPCGAVITASPPHVLKPAERPIESGLLLRLALRTLLSAAYCSAKCACAGCGTSKLTMNSDVPAGQSALAEPSQEPLAGLNQAACGAVVGAARTGGRACLDFSFHAATPVVRSTAAGAAAAAGFRGAVGFGSGGFAPLRGSGGAGATGDHLRRHSRNPNFILMNCARRPWKNMHGISVAHQIQFSGKSCVAVVVAKTCIPWTVVATSTDLEESGTAK